MNKNISFFLAVALIFSGFIFFFLRWLLTRSGESLVAVDAFIVSLISLALGIGLGGIIFCIVRARVVGGLLYGVMMTFNRKPMQGFRARKKLMPPRYYFKIKEHRFEMRDVSSAFNHTGVTRIAVDTDNSVLSIGDQEELQKLQGYIREHLFYGSIVSWFDDEKKSVKDMRALRTTIRLSILKLSKQFVFPPRPLVVFQIVGKTSYTASEIGEIEGLNEKVGAVEIYVWGGHELSDDEIADGPMPAEGWAGKRPDWKLKS